MTDQILHYIGGIVLFAHDPFAPAHFQESVVAHVTAETLGDDRELILRLVIMQDRFDRAHDRELHVVTITADVENRIGQGVVDQLRFQLPVHQNTAGGVSGVGGELPRLESVCRS